jgi:hypothetical protein
MTRRFKAFPPFIGHIRIPLSSRRAAVTAAALYTPGRPVTAFLRRLSLAYLASLGPRFLPGPARPWTPPFDDGKWTQLMSVLRGAVSFDDFAVYQRRQSVRRGFALLLISNGTGVGFVRVNRDRHVRFRREFEALGLLREARPLCFRAPEPICQGDLDEWSFLVTSALPPGKHQIARNPPLSAIAQDIQRALRTLPRPPETPDEWLPMHGDLVPINLRDAGDGQILLYDWESIKWGPPGADEVMYRTAEAVIAGRKPSLEGWPEAREFWLERFSRPASRDAAHQKWAVAMQEALRAGER